MSAAVTSPTPRDSLDSGSLEELCADGGEVHLDIAEARPWAQEHHDIDVPEDASSLFETFDGIYGY